MNDGVMTTEKFCKTSGFLLCWQNDTVHKNERLLRQVQNSEFTKKKSVTLRELAGKQNQRSIEFSDSQGVSGLGKVAVGSVASE